MPTGPWKISSVSPGCSSKLAGRAGGSRYRPGKMLLAVSRCIDKDPSVPHERKFDFPGRNGFAIVVRAVLAEGDRGLYEPCSVSHGVKHDTIAHSPSIFRSAVVLRTVPPW